MRDHRSRRHASVGGVVVHGGGGGNLFFVVYGRFQDRLTCERQCHAGEWHIYRRDRLRQQSISRALCARGLCTAGGTIQVRLGIGVNSTNAADATIRYSNVMVERVPKGQTYPNEYVRPGDQQVFAYTRTSVVTSGLEGTPTIGSTYAIPTRSSVLVLGDSFANDATDFPGNYATG